MATIPLHRSPQDRPWLREPTTRHRPLSAILLVAACAVVTAASLVLLAPIAWNAVEVAREVSPTLVQCAAIVIDRERLACFDQLGKQAQGAPAKGANAPLLAR